jgi:hypothetical protein
MKNDKGKNGEINDGVLKDLETWIQEHWHLKAKARRCSRPPDKAHKQEQRYGAAYSFHLCDRDRSQSIQLVVLVHFDGEKDYEVWAYPSESEGDIAWKRKPDGRVTFVAKDLAKQFRFKNIVEFKKGFRDRFPWFIATPWQVTLGDAVHFIAWTLSPSQRWVQPGGQKANSISLIQRRAQGSIPAR